MSPFELFTMVFFVLDAYWDDHKDVDLGIFLSGMNPFLFQGEGSAAPYVYTEFCDFLNGRKITLDDSFHIAQEYVRALDVPHIKEAFEWMDEKKWIESYNDYLLDRRE